jgi:magnesium transporter
MEREDHNPVILEEDLSMHAPKVGDLSETKVSCLDDIIHEKFDRAYNKENSKVSLHDLSKIAIEHAPIDLAKAVCHLTHIARPILFENLPNKEAKIQFLLNTDAESRSLILRFMKDQEMKDLIEKMSADQAINVLEDLSERRFKRILELISLKKANAIKELKRHHRNSASRLMTSAFFAFHLDMTVAEASQAIRDNPHVDFSKGIFVINDANELMGYVPGRNLIINDGKIALKQLMRSVEHTVSPEASREEVVDIVERYKFSFLPVVDQEKHMLGVISYEHVLEAMEDLADETMAKIAGTTEDVACDEPVKKRVLARSPWLFVTLIAGFLNFGIMSYFTKGEGPLLTVAVFFVPLITALSGNIGIQCSTILVRGLAIGLVSSKTKMETLLKELRVGLYNGIIFGILVGLLIGFTNHLFGTNLATIPLAITVGTGLLGACLMGTVLGAFSPIFFAKIGVDPAIASGPIITAFNDVLSMSIYFVVARALGSLLLT